MRIGRTLPPAAAPLYPSDLWNGFKGFFFGKRYLQRLEEELKEHFGVKHVFLVSSGKAALYLILQALKSLRPDKNEVLIPAYTCFSVPSAIVKADLKVALCDIDPATFDFNHELLKDSITDNTLCVVPDHLFGIPSDMERIMDLAADTGVFVVEDAAQAMGGNYKGKLLGTIGDIGFFSLGRGKNITCGSGGIVITNNDKISRSIQKRFVSLKTPNTLETIKDFVSTILLSIFIRPSLYWFPAGLPFLRLGETFFHRDFPVGRFSGMKGGLIKNWRARLEEANGIRARAAMELSKKSDSLRTTDPLVSYLRFPVIVTDVDTKNKLLALSRSKGLGLSGMYPTPINEIEHLRPTFQNRAFTCARFVADGIITFPTYQFSDRQEMRELWEILNHVRLLQ